MFLLENMAMTKIFRPNRDEVTGEWRKLHNEESYYLYSSPNIVRVIQNNKMGGACGTYGGQKTCIHGFGGETRGKRQLGRTRRRWENNIKMDLQEVGWGGMDWIDLTQDRESWRALVNAVRKLTIKCGEFLLPEDTLASQEGLLSMECLVFTMNDAETDCVSISRLQNLQQMPSR
jgi:hypothetical protein